MSVIILGRGFVVNSKEYKARKLRVEKSPQRRYGSVYGRRTFSPLQSVSNTRTTIPEFRLGNFKLRKRSRKMLEFLCELIFDLVELCSWK